MKKRSLELQRKKQLHIRLTDGEFQDLENQSKLKNVSLAKFCRDGLLYEKNKKAKVKPVLTNLSTENYIKELNQLSKIGNNINQLAYRANRKEPISSLLNELVEQVTEFKKWRKQQIK